MIYQKARRRILSATLRDPKGPGEKLLDVGCGVCQYFDIDSSKGYEHFGVDISMVALKKSKEKTVAVANGEFLPIGSSRFDGIVCTGSLEHFDSPSRGLEEMRRVLKSTGFLYLVVPNSSFWPRHFGYMGTEQPHEISMMKEEWITTLEEHGFEIKEVKKDPGPPIFKNLHPLGILKRLIIRLSPLKYCYQLVISATLLRSYKGQ